MSTTNARHPDRDTAAGTAGVGASRKAGFDASSGRWPSRARRAATITAGVALLVLVVTAVGFHLMGGRWMSVTTPSMGEAAPVGTLVLTRPVTLTELRVGDIISYHPPPQPTLTYTHRVVEISPTGVRTQGDINGAVDPWTVRDGDLVGKVTNRLWGLGWLARALPILLLGATVLWAGTRWLIPDRLRGPARLVGAALLVLPTTATLRPFVAAVQLVTTTGNGVSDVSMVSTGILPIRLSVANANATALDLRAGETGVLSITGQPPGGRADIGIGLHMPPSWWAVLVLIWLSPTLWVLLGGLRPAPTQPTTNNVSAADTATSASTRDLMSDLVDDPHRKTR